MQLNISNIQHFSVGDGDGIRTTVFFKGCNLRCPWCHNPENLSFAPCVMNYKAIGKTETMGKQVTVKQILPELLEDKDFFDQSGGGVTLSGGECLLQADGVLNLAKALKQNGVSVFVDTAGCLPYANFQKLNGNVDAYLFDYKTANSQRYKDIGGDLNLVRQNIQHLLADNADVRIRVPLIPDFNTDAQSVTAICKDLQSFGITSAELLPFHRLCTSKYEALGLEYPYKDYTPFSKQALDEIANCYSKYINIKIER